MTDLAIILVYLLLTSRPVNILLKNRVGLRGGRAAAFGHGLAIATGAAIAEWWVLLAAVAVAVPLLIWPVEIDDDMPDWYVSASQTRRWLFLTGIGTLIDGTALAIGVVVAKLAL